LKVDRRLLQSASSSRAVLLAAVLLGLLGGVLAAVQARLLSRVIAGVFLGGDILSQAVPGLGLLAVVLLVRAGLSWGLEIAANSAAVRIKTRLRQELFEHILALGPAATRGERTGELTETVVEGVEALHAYFSQYLPQLALAALVPLLLLAFIVPLDTLSALVLLLTAPLMPVFMVLIGSMAEALTRRQWRTLSRLSAYFLDVLQGMTTLKIFGRAQAQVRLIARLSEQYRRTTMQVLRVTFLSALVLELLATLSTAVVAVEVGLRLLYGRLQFEQALFVLLLAPEFYLPLRMLGMRFHAGLAGVAAAERIFEILSMPAGRMKTSISPKFACFSVSQRLETSQDSHLAFEGVSFALSDSPLALSGLSFVLIRGQRVALVGPSGAGKSTVANLLLRFIEPDQGRITLDGVDIAQIPADQWRQQIAWVSQRPYLFHDSVLANIRMARRQASYEEVVNAARLAHAHAFIEGLPDGYETIVGERGARLSGGQAQRIALARAFLKDAPILILDEATSSLDPEHEALVSDSLEKLIAGRMTLVIAHRLATVFRADQILVLDQGRLVEKGTHTELVGRGGLYQQLVHGSQNMRFSEIGDMRAQSTRISPISLSFPPSPCLADQQAMAEGLLHSEQAREGGSKICRSQGDRPGEMGTFRKLLRMVLPFAGWITLAILLGAATVGSGIGLMSASAYIISAAALKPSIAELQVAIVGVRFFGLARGLFRYLERYVSHRVTFQVLARLRVWFYQSLEPLAPARLLAYRGGDLLSRAIGDMAELESFYVRALAPPLVAGIVAVGTLAYLYAFAPALAFTLSLFFALGGVGVTWLARQSGKGVGQELVEVRAGLNILLVDSVQGLADVLALGLERYRSQELAELSRRFGSAQMRIARLGGLQSSLSGLLAHLAMWALLVQAIPLVRDGQIEGTYLAVLTLAALTSFEALLPLPLAAQHLESHLAAARRLFQLVDAQPEVKDPPHPVLAPDSYALQVKGLSFTYPTAFQGDGLSIRRVLDDLSFSLPQGGKLALVGSSGAGKTTLVQLLLRFWDYSEGSILLGGKELCHYRQEDARRLFSVVSQDTYLFNATIKENLLVARPDVSDEELFQAARQAQIHDFILSLPEGYQTWIGEQGLRLSGGERQRLAIARALLKNAPLLILDEPTANLDMLTERKLVENLYRLMDGRTTLLITHRLVGLEAMEEILVLEAGHVVERGRHQDLLEAGGLYRRMWDLQNQVLVWDGGKVGA